MEPPYRRPTPGTPLCLLGPIACFSDRGRLARAGRHATTARAKACRDRADDGDPLQLIGPACPPKTLVSGRVLSVACVARWPQVPSDQPSSRIAAANTTLLARSSP